MKARISGPRSELTGKLPMPWLSIDLELEELPKRGDVIIVNSGSSYYVTDIMWWIDGPENDAYRDRHKDYKTENGQYQVVHITVSPENRRERYGYPAGLEDGKAQGGNALTAELRQLIELIKASGVTGDTCMNLVDTWVAQREQAKETPQRPSGHEEAGTP